MGDVVVEKIVEGGDRGLVHGPAADITEQRRFGGISSSASIVLEVNDELRPCFET